MVSKARDYPLTNPLLTLSSSSPAGNTASQLANVMTVFIRTTAYNLCKFLDANYDTAPSDLLLVLSLDDSDGLVTTGSPPRSLRISDLTQALQRGFEGMPVFTLFHSASPNGYPMASWTQKTRHGLGKHSGNPSGIDMQTERDQDLIWVTEGQTSRVDIASTDPVGCHFCQPPSLAKLPLYCGASGHCLVPPEYCYENDRYLESGLGSRMSILVCETCSL